MGSPLGEQKYVLIVPVAHFDECQVTESASTPLLCINAKMIEKGSVPEAKEELILSNPEKWSPEAPNFLFVTSGGL